MSVTVHPIRPTRHYRGKRARRAAFYKRQRLSRVLQRFVREESAKWHASIDQAHRDMLVTGVGWLGVRRSEDQKHHPFVVLVHPENDWYDALSAPTQPEPGQTLYRGEIGNLHG